MMPLIVEQRAASSIWPENTLASTDDPQFFVRRPV